jgi:hypothetical protein
VQEDDEGKMSSQRQQEEIQLVDECCGLIVAMLHVCAGVPVEMHPSAACCIISMRVSDEGLRIVGNQGCLKQFIQGGTAGCRSGTVLHKCGAQDLSPALLVACYT